MKLRAAAIMFQGTSSDVGKSLLTTALCRILHQDGLKVAPFKSQNMSLNAYVTLDGKEIGRAQGMQAEACAIVATTDMNPILLKPSRDMAAQVVVHGEIYRELDARAYRERYLPVAEGIVREALNRLLAEYDAVIIEGAGSPAEINLKDKDIVNMRVAEWAQAPVILVADIDRGGAFASIVGTIALLEPHERDRVCGVIINKFRGDPSLLQPGIDWLEARIGKPVLGVVPYLDGLALEDEDGASLDRKLAVQMRSHREAGGQKRNGDGSLLDIAILRLPRISNFTDFDPLLIEPDVQVRYVTSVHDFGQPDAVIVPGSKNTAEDLLYLRRTGLADKLLEFVADGGRIVGICGGYQMLGERLLDPDGVESEQRELAGLGLLPTTTTFRADKKTVRIAGETTASALFPAAGLPVQGYEIHMGETEFTGAAIRPFAICELPGRGADTGATGMHEEVAATADGRIWGTYIHGILHNDALRLSWLNSLRAVRGLPIQAQPSEFGVLREQSFDRLAAHFRQYVDMARIYSILREGGDSH